MRSAAKSYARREAALLAAQAWAELAPPPDVLRITCPGCSALLVPLRSNSRYCSNKCKQRAYRQRRRDANPQPQEAG